MDESLLYFAAVRGSESRVWQHVTWALTWGGPSGGPGEPLLGGSPSPCDGRRVAITARGSNTWSRTPADAPITLTLLSASQTPVRRSRSELSVPSAQLEAGREVPSMFFA